LLAITTGAEFELNACPFALTLFGEIETTSAGSDVDGAVAAAFTAATFAPLAIAKVPDEIELMVPTVAREPELTKTVPELSDPMLATD